MPAGRPVAVEEEEGRRKGKERGKEKATPATVAIR